MLRTLKDRWYQLKCWAWYRHSTVKPRWLGHTWVDRDELLAHCMFEILGQFLERECGPEGIVDWETEPKDAAALAEMRELWRWWTEEYLKYDGYEKFLAPAPKPKLVREETGGKGTLVRTVFEAPEDYGKWESACRQMTEADQAMKTELAARLKRLIDVKDWMWT
jgi:hypothetical protein